MQSVVNVVENALAAVLLVTQLSVTQSVIVVRNVRFTGDLGLPEKELQEWTEFVKGYPLEESKVLKQSTYASRKALQHRGFLKAQVTPTILDTHGSDATSKDDRILQLTIHAGQQYRVKDISFSGLASEFPANELREAIHLRQGDIADGNEIEAGLATLTGLFKRTGKRYVTLTQVMLDDSAHSASFIFDIEHDSQ
jgi:outer membrane protein assembly factor BamA